MCLMCTRVYFGMSVEESRICKRAMKLDNPQSSNPHAIKLQDVTMNDKMLISLFQFLGPVEIACFVRLSRWLYTFTKRKKSLWKALHDRERSSHSMFSGEVFSGEPGVYFVMPDVDCAESWRLYYRQCLKKRRWLTDVHRNIGDKGSKLIGFLTSYLKYRNPGFGKMRAFSYNEIVITLDMRSEGADVEDHAVGALTFNVGYEKLELLYQQTVNMTTVILPSGTIAVIRLCTSPNDKPIYLITLTPQSPVARPYVSFADVGNVVCDRNCFQLACFGGNEQCGDGATTPSTLDTCTVAENGAPIAPFTFILGPIHAITQQMPYEIFTFIK